VCQTRAIRFNYGATKVVSAECQRNSKWVSRTDLSADFALCRTSTSIQTPDEFLFETVDTTSIAPSKSNRIPVLLTGYGCVSDAVLNDQTDNKYRIGSTELIGGSNSADQPYGRKFSTAGGQANNLFTVDEDGKANLCGGDSGGPVFSEDNVPSVRQFQGRRVIGINSRVIYHADGVTYGASILSSLGGPDFRSWALDWLSSRQLAACGLAGGLHRCRT
jgi:hypothetical protein